MQSKTLYEAYWQPDLNRRIAFDFHNNHDLTERTGELQQFGVMQDKMESYTDSSAFFFMLDFSKMKFIYVSKSVKKITGYHAEDFLNDGFSFCCKIWHPKDAGILKQLHQKLFAYYYATPINERTKLKFSYNLRLKRKDSAYMNVLQQTVFIKVNERGKPLVDFTTITDITPFKKDHHLTLVIQKLNSMGEYEQVYKEEFYNYDFAFTRRQLEIMGLISKGMTTKEIAANLFLSADTVKNHRKNILKMTGSKNVVEVYRSMVS
ncbi:MAG: LuxR C-terminal-related transcriptional regulator [Chryseosolibacter sp.]